MENDKNKKFQSIVQTASELFFRFGIKRITVEEICREAGVSKMTFYKHFKNKMELAEYMINQIFEDSKARYFQIMNQDIPYREKIKQIIRMKMNQIDKMCQNFFDEWNLRSEPELKKLIDEKTAEISELILNDYRRAQQRGDIRKDIKLEFIHYFLNHITDMLKNKKLIRLYDTPEQLREELVDFLFYGILPRN